MVGERMQDIWLGAYIRTWRNYSHQTVFELAKATGLKRDRLYQLEHACARRALTKRECASLASALGIDPVELIQRAGGSA